MTTDYRDLITRMAKELDNYRQLLLDDRTATHRLSDEARAALADGPAVPEVVGSEWQPCVKLPITVHVREQRPGEQHVSTREGITPVQSDDLIMLGVDGEEYPIGRELFQRTYRMGSADEPAAVTGQPRPTEDDVEDAAQCIYEAMRFERVETTPAWSELGNSLAQDTARKAARAVLAHWGNPAPTPPAAGEVAELVEWLREQLHVCLQAPWTPGIKHFGRAAELLERQVLVPVPVSERLPGPEDCDASGRCWWLHVGEDGVGDWLQRAPYPSVTSYALFRMTHWLPAHALPLPEVGE